MLIAGIRATFKSIPSFYFVSKANSSLAFLLCFVFYSIGLSTFGSAFMMGLGYFKTQTESSTTFGALICVSGIVATPLGGISKPCSCFMHNFIVFI